MEMNNIVANVVIKHVIHNMEHQYVVNELVVRVETRNKVVIH